MAPFSDQFCDSTSLDNLSWYDWWVREQVKTQPNELFSSIPTEAIISSAPWMEAFKKVWQETAQFLRSHESGSIDRILAHLLERGYVQLGDSSIAHTTAKSLLFAIIGWQTMLYQPDIHSSPFSQVAIENQMGLHQGQCHMSLKQPISASKKPMPDFLLGFGMLLPPRQFCAAESADEKAAFTQWTTVTSESFNAHFLSLFGGVRIAWVDSLPCHLEFDNDSNTLFLFRYPSYCLANLEYADQPNRVHRSVLYSCGLTHRSSSPWANEADISQMLQEIILSYRLLYGQNRMSRKLFHGLEPFNAIPAPGRDSILTKLCGQKRFKLPRGWQEREIYDLPRDFPILRSRLAFLIGHLSTKKPRTWKEHWMDKRDSASWLTFWAVIIIGGMGIFLGFIQVILQIVQIVKS